MLAHKRFALAITGGMCLALFTTQTATAQDADAGAALFEENRSFCHQADAIGEPGVASERHARRRVRRSGWIGSQSKIQIHSNDTRIHARESESPTPTTA